MANNCHLGYSFEDNTRVEIKNTLNMDFDAKALCPGDPINDTDDQKCVQGDTEGFCYYVSL